MVDSSIPPGQKFYMVIQKRLKEPDTHGIRVRHPVNLFAHKIILMYSICFKICSSYKRSFNFPLRYTIPNTKHSRSICFQYKSHHTCINNYKNLIHLHKDRMILEIMMLKRGPCSTKTFWKKYFT
jgi:hypothetical protein